MKAIQLEARPHELLLHVDHSSLVFSLDATAVRLIRDGRLILQTGSGWGNSPLALSGWSLNGTTALLTFQYTDGATATLSITGTEHGWHLAWDAVTKDTFAITSGEHWYGHGELVHQLWPLERMSLWESPLITWDNGPTGLCCVLEPLWISSTGAAILLDETTDHTVIGFNAPPTTVTPPAWGLTDPHSPAAHRPHSSLPGSSGLLTMSDASSPLSYHLIAADNARDAFLKVTSILPRPDSPPPSALLHAPIWTTWAEYKTEIDQERIAVKTCPEIQQGMIARAAVQNPSKMRCGLAPLHW